MNFTMKPALFRTLMVVFIIALFGIFLAGGKLIVDTFFSIPEVSDEPIQWGQSNQRTAASGHTLEDSLLQTKVEQTVVSGNIQAGRMGSYDGVCTDIVVVAPIRCEQSVTGYSLSAPMSDGTYFCVDSEGFKGFIEKRPAQASLCLTGAAE